ncbi:MAG: hypothetical protein ACTMIY_11020 [Microbacterium gubbeenense]
MTLSGWLTIAEAAMRVGKSERTVRDWVARRGLVRIGDRVPERALVDLAEKMEKRKGGRPPKPLQPLP